MQSAVSAYQGIPEQFSHVLSPHSLHQTESARTALQAQVDSLTVQAQALQREKKALEGRVAQQGREARGSEDALKAGGGAGRHSCICL